MGDLYDLTRTRDLGVGWGSIGRRVPFDLRPSTPVPRPRQHYGGHSGPSGPNPLSTPPGSFLFFPEPVRGRPGVWCTGKGKGEGLFLLPCSGSSVGGGTRGPRPTSVEVRTHMTRGGGGPRVDKDRDTFPSGSEVRRTGGKDEDRHEIN